MSPKLAETLKESLTYVLGTVQKRRKGMPKMIGKLPKGAVDTYTDDHILIERWMDRREVCILNTFMEHQMVDSVSSNPKNTRKKPATVLLYNKTMGAVDNVDKTTKPYQSVRKSLKWYKKVAFNLIDISIYNSYVLYLHLNPGKNLPFKKYILILIDEILRKYPVQKRIQGRPTAATTSVSDRLKGQHHPQKHSQSGTGKTLFLDCVYCKNHATDKKRKGTSFSCKTCKVRLCIQGETSCFERFHTEKKLGSSNSQSQCHQPSQTQPFQPSENQDIEPSQDHVMESSQVVPENSPSLLNELSEPFNDEESRFY